jgi:hypothetical protein
MPVDQGSTIYDDRGRHGIAWLCILFGLLHGILYWFAPFRVTNFPIKVSNISTVLLNEPLHGQWLIQAAGAVFWIPLVMSFIMILVACLGRQLPVLVIGFLALIGDVVILWAFQSIVFSTLTVRELIRLLHLTHYTELLELSPYDARFKMGWGGYLMLVSDVLFTIFVVTIDNKLPGITLGKGRRSKPPEYDQLSW